MTKRIFNHLRCGFTALTGVVRSWLYLSEPPKRDQGMTAVYIVWELTRREHGEADTLVQVCASRSVAEKVTLEVGLVEEGVDYAIESRWVREQ